MLNRYLLAVSAALVIGSAASAAEPVKPELRESAQPASRPAQVVLASADQVQTTPPNVAEQAAAPVKRPRAARVTTCRCGTQDQAVER